MLLITGVGARTVRSLTMGAEIVHGCRYTSACAAAAARPIPSFAEPRPAAAGADVAGVEEDDARLGRGRRRDPHKATAAT